MDEKTNILLVDDSPAELSSYEAVLTELGDNRINASSISSADTRRHGLRSSLRCGCSLLKI